jgi:hypothetical protein
VLVNNAGVLDFGTMTHETSLDDYMRLVNINQVGVFLGMRAAIPTMLARGGGSIVNISSTNGFAGYGGTIAYTASKFAVRGMTKTAALEYGKAGIRVNSIHPGGIDTPMTRSDELGEMTEADQEAMYGGFALGRVGQPEEVAKLALFLASDDSSYCTGAEFWSTVACWRDSSAPTLERNARSPERPGGAGSRPGLLRSAVAPRCTARSDGGPGYDDHPPGPLTSGTGQLAVTTRGLSVRSRLLRRPGRSGPLTSGGGQPLRVSW